MQGGCMLDWDVGEIFIWGRRRGYPLWLQFRRGTDSLLADKELLRNREASKKLKDDTVTYFELYTILAKGMIR